MRRLRRISAFLLGVEVAVLAATGMGLFLIYRPEPPAGADLEPDERAAEAFRLAHELTTYAAVGTLILFAVGYLGTSSLRNWRTSVRLVGLLASLVAVLVTGAAIAWDRLVLTASARGEVVSGFPPLVIDDDVVSVFVDGTELEPRTLAVWSAAHVFSVVVLVAFAFVRRPRPTDDATGDATDDATGDEGRI